ncbi:MAG: UDP-N-acetylmuramoyl-L-alanyl-D-glutamate--2,6-diaminopimelate ligase [Deltaproteobacteria bacterium]|nr:UDP-N-acetylmuramoyl-L-alanyl-D-glutamate--2,6-diaminopimelate ligase [Deltaproteobacteria bacterium]
MKLTDIIQALEVISVAGDPEGIEISSVEYDSRSVGPGSLFAAVRGFTDDGRRYVKDAVKAGAAAVMIDAPLSENPSAPVLMVPNVRRAMAMAAVEVYGHPSKDLTLIGVTGTKGKTTVTFLLESIFRQGGRKTGLTGSIKVSVAGKERPAAINTPEGPDLQRYLHEMVESGVTRAVVEVSSQGLALSRTVGCSFDVGVFTNLGQDHLDFHRDMRAYFESKKILFTRQLTGSHLAGGPKAVVNVDDEWGRKLAEELKPAVITFGLDSEADLTAREIKSAGMTLSALLQTPAGEMEVHSRLIGAVNLYNLLAAAGAALALDVEPSRIVKGLESLQGVPGRLEKVGSNEAYLVLVDYAHTSEALSQTLNSIRNLAPRRLITVFGCGGDRDRLKRPLMGRASGSYSDLTILTSDNPRTEEPMSIIEEIEPGLKNLDVIRVDPGGLSEHFPRCTYTVIPDRRKAIRAGAKLLQPGDILVVAGKGHEDYQILGREKVHFDDREEVLEALTAEGKA